MRQQGRASVRRRTLSGLSGDVEPAEDLSLQLWTMRELLEQLVYKLELQGLLLGAGRARWLPYITNEIEAVIEAIGVVEHDRHAASLRVARAYRIEPTMSLAEMVAHVPEPWAGLLAQHRLHLLSLQSEIEDIARTNHEMARRSLMRSREIVASLGEPTVDLYDPRGATTPLAMASLRLDRSV